MILFELSIQIYVYANDWNAFLVGEEFVHSCSGPLGVSDWEGNALCKENINNFAQAGSGKILLKYIADHICFFFMHDDFLANQNIAIWKFHNFLTFLNINKSRFKR